LLKFGTKFDHVTAHTLHCSRSKVRGEGQRSKVKVTASHKILAVKRYKTAADRLTDFKLRKGISVKVANDWRGVGRPQVAMHHNWDIF